MHDKCRIGIKFAISFLPFFFILFFFYFSFYFRGAGGGGRGGHADPEIRRGWPQKIFRPVGPQFGQKIRGAGPPGSLPWIRHGYRTRSLPVRISVQKEGALQTAKIPENRAPG